MTNSREEQLANDALYSSLASAKSVISGKIRDLRFNQGKESEIKKYMGLLEACMMLELAMYNGEI
jgi:hypothetical protein